jgi:hypothetical protein
MSERIEFFEVVWIYDDGHAELYWMTEKGMSLMEYPACKICISVSLFKISS